MRQRKGFTRPALLITACILYACPAAAQDVGRLNCDIFPPDNIWNAPIDNLPVDANSDAYVRSIGADKPLHPDFGAGLWQGHPIGIPFALIVSSELKVPVLFQYGKESDNASYPLPYDVPIEGNGTGDAHVVVIDTNSCMLYELFGASRQFGGWRAGSGAVFDLRSNDLRPAGWTSADAAGLPIFPGLVRYDEVAAGEIRHALRFTAPRTRNEYVWPARHQASRLSDPRYPPMGERFRLKSSVDITRFSRDAQVVMQALKTYGMFLADNGSPWFISGTPDRHWSDQFIDDLKKLNGSDFEAVDEFSLRKDNKSGAIRTVLPINEASLRMVQNPDTPGAFSVILDSPKGSAPAALQWELYLPPVIEVTKADITIGEAAKSSGKSLTCTNRTAIRRLTRYGCILAGGHEPISNGAIANFQYQVQWDLHGAPVNVEVRNILASLRDSKTIRMADVDCPIDISKKGPVLRLDLTDESANSRYRHYRADQRAAVLDNVLQLLTLDCSGACPRRYSQCLSQVISYRVPRAAMAALARFRFCRAENTKVQPRYAPILTRQFYPYRRINGEVFGTDAWASPKLRRERSWCWRRQDLSLCGINLFPIRTQNYNSLLPLPRMNDAVTFQTDRLRVAELVPPPCGRYLRW